MIRGQETGEEQSFAVLVLCVFSLRVCFLFMMRAAAVLGRNYHQRGRTNALLGFRLLSWFVRLFGFAWAGTAISYNGEWTDS